MCSNFGLHLSALFIQSTRYFKVYIYFMCCLCIFFNCIVLGFCLLNYKQQNNSHFYCFCIISLCVMDFLTIIVEISFCSQNFKIKFFVLDPFFTTTVVYVWIYTTIVVYVVKIFQLLWHLNIMLVQIYIYIKREREIF